MSLNYLRLSYDRKVSKLLSNPVYGNFANCCRTVASAIVVKYFVNRLTTPTGLKQEGIEVRILQAHAQSPSQLFEVIPSQSETIRSIKIDVDATLRAYNRTKLS